MQANPFLGVVFHWLGGLASGSFYVPYRGVKKWAWEVYWLVGGFFSWIIAPWILASLQTSDLLASSARRPPRALVWAYFFGVMWGLGGLTFGLTMRYLGMSLGMAVALGYCAAFGTLVPPIFHGEFADARSSARRPGQVILIGIVVCLLGIAIAGLAGHVQGAGDDRGAEEGVDQGVQLHEGHSGGHVLGHHERLLRLRPGRRRARSPRLSAEHGTSPLWTGLPKLCVVLLGGFTTNFIWCVLLNIRNRTGYQYFSPRSADTVPERDEETIIETAIDAPGEEVVEHMPWPSGTRSSACRCSQLPLQRPGRRDLVLAVLLLHDGRDPDGRVQVLQLDAPHGQHHHLQLAVGHRPQGMEGQQPLHQDELGLGLAMLIFSTIIVGYGNYLGSRPRWRPPGPGAERGFPTRRP